MATDKHNHSDTALPLVIVNPKSASGSTSDTWAGKASELRTHFGAFNVAFTSGPGHAIDLAGEAAIAGRSFIIACGGDGTINEVANGILRSGAAAELGVLPSGTGGDFRRSLGVSPNIREVAVGLRDGVTRLMDVGKITYRDFNNDPATRYFLNVSSVGLAPSVINRVKSTNAFDWIPAAGIRGRANFAISALQEVLGRDPFLVRLSLDGGKPVTIQTLSLCIANARYFGGGMMIAPDADINDGLLDVVNIGDIKTVKILFNAYSLYRGTHQKLDEVKSTTARTIEISAADEGSELAIETDGELPGKLPALYEVVPNALKIRVPKIVN
ncbi:MAG: diacylglycerol kinase family protein [Pyrinomonadaceae bacterium]